MRAHAKLTRSGTCWARSVLSSEDVGDQLRIKHHPPPPDAVFLRNLQRKMFWQEPLVRKGKQPSEKQLQDNAVLKVEYQRICNGHPFARVPVHYCCPEVGCECTSPEDSSKRFNKCTRSVHLRCRPYESADKEWTGIEKAATYHASQITHHGMHRFIFDRATSKLPARDGNLLHLVPGAQWQDAPQSSFFDDVDWHKMMGSRVRCVRDKLMPTSADFRVLFIAMTSGCLETISYRLFQKVKDIKGVPLLMRFTYKNTNPATLPLQWFSSMLAAQHPGLRLLTGSLGYKDTASFLRYEKDLAHMMRKTLINLTLTGYVRFIRKVVETWPWKVATVANDSAPMPVRKAVSVDFCKGCERCLDFGWLRQLRGAVMEPDDLFDDLLQEAIWLWALSHDCENDNMELGVAGCKHSNTQLSKWELVCSRHINRVAASAYGKLSRREEAGDQKPAEDESGNSDDGPNLKWSGNARAPWKSAFQAFHSFAAKRDTALGHHFQPVSKEYWQKCRAEFFTDMSDEQRAQYETKQEDAANLAVSAARAARAPQPEPVASCVALVPADAPACNSRVKIWSVNNVIGGHVEQPRSKGSACPMGPQRLRSILFASTVVLAG